jgi:hypothetical protein
MTGPGFVVLPGLLGRGGGNLPQSQAGGLLGRAYDPLVLSPDAIGSTVNSPSWSLGGSGQRPNLRPCDVDSVVNSPSWLLAQEPPAMREAYGATRFGRCCLLARQLVEAGVRLVTINTAQSVYHEASWDIHGRSPFATVADMQDAVAPAYDRAYAALLEDLARRGLLDTTLVACLAEFGRTPQINAAGGRDHWPHCFTCCFAGGGVQGGRVIGCSDTTGSEPVDRPVAPPELVATILHALGVDLQTLLPGPDGSPWPVVAPGTRPIHELF